MNFVLDFIITVVAYMLFPFILFKVIKKRYSKKKTYIINLINSLIIMTCFIAVRSFLGENTTTSGAPALLYLMINNLLYPVKNKQKKDTNENNEKIKNKKQNKIKKTKSKKKVIIISIVSALIVALSVSNIIFIVKYYNSKNELNEKKQLIEEQHNDYLELLGTNISILQGREKEYIINKLNFFDNNIVFVIDGYGNYYSNYDCTMQRVGNSEYSYWAFNVEAAKSQGYKEYKCK